MLVAGNWKMFKGAHEARAFATRIRHIPERTPGVEVVVCPPFVSLQATLQGLGEGSLVRVYAQSVHWELDGAFTGEVSAPMLLELGVDGVILGHSERRQHFGESDEALARKVPVALAAGLEPILCVGEREEQRDAGETGVVLTRQIDADLAEVADDDLGAVVIAYEPIWAIGTGRTATPDQAEEAIALIRERIDARSADAAARVRILYGGSVKPENAAELMAQPDVDGALVGGASLEVESFARICEAATLIHS
jgi:triosephosphate isomerase